MSCHEVRASFSSHRDGDLPATESRALDLHLEACGDCAMEWHAYGAALEGLTELPRLEPRESIAARVRDRLELERRGPGLALLFRPTWAARPLIVPSLVPAAFVLVGVLVGCLGLTKPEPLPPVAAHLRNGPWGAILAWGTETNPLAPAEDVSTPRMTSVPPEELMAAMSEGSMLFESVVARDGRVTAVHLVEGDPSAAAAVMAALLNERFEPGRFRGRPVAVSVYRLVSRMDVKAPRT